jgi:2-polyprenyl-3-methyl-5-hydroxy-6-metoxy-1,4-benzoquinol methylase
LERQSPINEEEDMSDLAAASETATKYDFGQWQQHRLWETAGRSVEAAEPDVLRAVQQRLDQLLAGADGPVRILDAGCGKQLQIPIAANRHVVGIDVSPEQVARNLEIDEGIVGNVQSHRFEPESFDLVVCWNVLEHLNDPRAALLNFERALRHGGVLLLAAPHPHSFKGTVTKLTPFWAHRLAWRRLLPGQPTLERFPTHMSDLGSPDQLTQALGEFGLRVELLTMYEGWEQRSFRRKPGVGGSAFRAAIRAVEVLSLGSVSAAVTDFVLVASK